MTIPSWASWARHLGRPGPGVFWGCWYLSLSQAFWWDTGQRRAEGRAEETRSPPTQAVWKLQPMAWGQCPLPRGPQEHLGLEARAGFGLPAAGRREGAPRLRAVGACREPHVGPTLHFPCQFAGQEPGLQGRPLRPTASQRLLPKPAVCQVLGWARPGQTSRNPDCPEAWGNPGSLPPGGAARADPGERGL